MVMESLAIVPVFQGSREIVQDGKYLRLFEETWMMGDS
jgi:hypothetical protein